MKDQLPDYVHLSAITSSIRCNLCEKDTSLIDLLRDGKEAELCSEIKLFIRSHRDCTKPITIILDKMQLFKIAQSGKSPERFVIDAVRKEINFQISVS